MRFRSSLGPLVAGVGGRDGDDDAALILEQKFLGHGVYLVESDGALLVGDRVDEIGIIEINGVITDQDCGEERGAAALDELAPCEPTLRSNFNGPQVLPVRGPRQQLPPSDRPVTNPRLR